MAIGYAEVLIVLIIVLILFGPKKLPELARAVGKSIKEYKKEVNSTDTTTTPRRKKSKKA